MSVGRQAIIVAPTDEPYNVWALGDLHLGAAACDEALLQKVCNQIASDPQALWVGMGDYIDAIGVRDKRWEAGGLAAWLYDPLSMQDIIGTQLRRLTDRYLDPIADKCLGLLYGNHESKAAKWMERDIAGHINSALRAKRGDNADLMLGYEGFIIASFREPPIASGTKTATRGTLRIYGHHGSGAAATPAGRTTRLIKSMQGIEADLFLMGHVHDQRSHMEIIRRQDDRGYLRRRTRLGMITGTFLGQSAYAIEKGYPPPMVGAPYATFYPKTGELEPRFPPALTQWRKS